MGIGGAPGAIAVQGVGSAVPANDRQYLVAEVCARKIAAQKRLGGGACSFMPEGAPATLRIAPGGAGFAEIVQQGAEHEDDIARPVAPA